MIPFEVVDRVFHSYMNDHRFTTGVFEERDIAKCIQSEISFDELEKLRAEALHDKEFFNALYEEFDRKAKEVSDLFKPSEPAKRILNDLHRDGVAKFSQMFKEEDLNMLVMYQTWVHEQIYPVQNVSGYVLPSSEKGKKIKKPDAGLVIEPANDNFKFLPSFPNDGQVRYQSKSWNGTHPYGSSELIENDLIKEVFTTYNCMNHSGDFRSNMEWIHPAPLNHNGWHRDCTAPQLKAMVLLSDVDSYTAPVMYAKKSHKLTTEYDKQHLYDRFCFAGKGKYGYKKTWPNFRNNWPEHSIRKAEKHCGYVSNTSAPNDILPKDRVNNSKIQIGNCSYDLFVGTGRIGDVIFFESCGLHSGNRAHFESRKNITISTVTSTSPKRAFFELLNPGQN